MIRDIEAELLELMKRLLDCSSYEDFRPLTKEFYQLYFDDRTEGALSDEVNQFFDEVNDQISETDWMADLTLDEFKAWLAGALAQYPKPTEFWRRHPL